MGEAIIRNLKEKFPNQNLPPLEIKNIRYNFFAKLPNFLKINGLFGVKQKFKQSLFNLPEAPQIIISAGRKNAPITLFLKNYYQNLAVKNGNPSDVFLTQIMNPNLRTSQIKNFDLILLPSHDRSISKATIERIIGALGRVNNQLLNKEYLQFAPLFSQIHSPKIAFLLGGASKNNSFSNQTAKNLANHISQIVNNMNGHLLALNSRRTGNSITKIVDDNLTCSKTFFKWKQDSLESPYFAVLQTADFIVVTGDSVSMCCEVCNLGKPVYIFNPEEICSPKHLKLHQHLFDNGFAKKLDFNLNELGNYPANKLDETSRIADLLIDKIYIKKQKL